MRQATLELDPPIPQRQLNRQETIVLGVFQQYEHGLTPSAAHRQLDCRWPPTSTRRAITDLTGYGYLVKTTTRRPGPYGAAERVWRLA